MPERMSSIKRLAAIGATVALTAALAACGGDDEPSGNPAETDGSETVASGGATTTDGGTATTTAPTPPAGDDATGSEGGEGRDTGGGGGAAAQGASPQDDAQGGGDDEDKAASGAPEPDDGVGGAGSDSAKRQVARVVEGMYRDLATGDAAGVCGAMSSAVRDQIAQNVPGGSTRPRSQRTCADSMSKFLSAAADSGVLERTLGADVQRVRIDGRVATATVSFRGGSGDVQLRREDGAWRFGSNVVGARS